VAETPFAQKLFAAFGEAARDYRDGGRAHTAPAPRAVGRG
jgi:hypothetical protein